MMTGDGRADRPIRAPREVVNIRIRIAVSRFVKRQLRDLQRLSVVDIGIGICDYYRYEALRSRLTLLRYTLPKTLFG